jgi:hypothetical protein
MNLWRRPPDFIRSLPIPSRDEIIASPVQDHAPPNGATSGYTGASSTVNEPMLDDPSAELERELSRQNLGK